MSDSFYYISGATGERIDLDGEVVSTDGALGLRTTLQTYNLGHRSLKSIVNSATAAACPIAFVDKDDADRLNRIILADTARRKPGVFYGGEWSQRGYILGFTPSNLSPNSLEGSVQCALLDGAWHKPRLMHLFPSSGDESGTKKYPYKYPYRYASKFGVRSVTVESMVPVPFVMTIFGYVRNPNIRIGNNVYSVKVTVPTGGYLQLDSRDCTAVLVSADGLRQNVYDLCERSTGEGSGLYAWEKIPIGTNNVRWNDTFGFDLTVFEEELAPPFGSDAS